MARRRTKKSKIQRINASLRWAARFHGQVVRVNGAQLGIARGFAVGKWGKVEVYSIGIYSVLSNQIISYYRKGLKLATNSEAVMARLTGELPDVKIKDDPDLVRLVKFLRGNSERRQ